MSVGTTLNRLISRMCLRQTRELPIWCELFRHAMGGQERTATRAPAALAAYSGHEQPARFLHQGCVGCESQGRPGRSGRPNRQYQGSGNRRRGTRRSGAAAALERREVQRVLHGVVRSTSAVAPAALSALVRTRLHGAVREPVNGEAGAGEARRVAEPSRGDARSRRSRGQGERGGHRDERRAQRRREEDTAAPWTVRSNEATSVSSRQRRRAQRAAGQAGARSARSARRREGYPPEGARPRSGLDRVARSRSDAPNNNLSTRAGVSMLGTIECITVSSMVVIISVDVIGTSVSIGVGSCRAWCGGRAAEPPRRAAPQATRDAKAGRAVAARAERREADRAAG